MAEPVGIVAKIETALVERLRARIRRLAVDAHPGNPSTWRMAHQVGQLLVRYQESRYGQVEDVGLVVQERTATFVVTVLARNLRDHRDLSGHLEEVRLALQGWRPPASMGKLRLVWDQFVDEQDGVWRHDVALSTTLPAVEEGEGEDEGAGEASRLSRAVFEDEYGAARVPTAEE